MTKKAAQVVDMLTVPMLTVKELIWKDRQPLERPEEWSDQVLLHVLESHARGYAFGTAGFIEDDWKARGLEYMRQTLRDYAGVLAKKGLKVIITAGGQFAIAEGVCA